MDQKIERRVCCDVVWNDAWLVISKDRSCRESDTDRQRAGVQTLCLLTYIENKREGQVVLLLKPVGQNR